jgi:hypothetical protein
MEINIRGIIADTKSKFSEASVHQDFERIIKEILVQVYKDTDEYTSDDIVISVAINGTRFRVDIALEKFLGMPVHRFEALLREKLPKNFRIEDIFFENT